MTFVVKQCIFILSIWIFIDVIQAKGSNQIRYRAARYGNYYSSVYYSYSGGKGYARYSRVYSHSENLYPALYRYMFEWFKTDQYKVYKKTPSGSISVCKNYEADENGTYLGIFTCPLPFVPQDHSYCCGQTDAQYCCKFWDLTLNLAAACIVILMGLLIILTFIFITRQLCINRSKINEENNRLKAVRRIGVMRRLGRRVTASSVWAHALFERVHAPGNYSEYSYNEKEEEEGEDSETETRNENIQMNMINVMKSVSEQVSNQNNNEVTNTSNGGDNIENINIDPKDGAFEFTPDNRSGRTFPVLENGFIGEKPDCEGDRHESFTNKAFLAPLSETRDVKDIPLADFPLKPLRNSPRIKFNSDFSKRKQMKNEFM